MDHVSQRLTSVSQSKWFFASNIFEALVLKTHRQIFKLFVLSKVFLKVLNRSTVKVNI